MKTSEFYPNFKVFHELMANKIREILLVASSYDAFIIEQDGSLASRIINEYSGLNLSQPPRITRTGSAATALSILRERPYDMVITMPRLEDMNAFTLGAEIKKIRPDMPVILLAHGSQHIRPEAQKFEGIDKVFVWSGNSDLLLALVKNAEDRLNIEADTQRARVRVLILVEDSPVYYSSFLPLIYKEFVRQTQAVLGEGLNEEHRLLKMRARPKIVLAENYEEAEQLYHRYRQFLFGILSDARFPRNGRMDDEAGFRFLSQVRQEIADLPLLMFSSDPANRDLAAAVPAAFLDKNSPNLLAELHDFFLTHLGFGDFVFRMPDGSEVERASSLRELEKKLTSIPDESLWYHAERNHFSNWIMGRSEIVLASWFREVQASEFTHADDLREFIISNIHALRKWRQRGVVTVFKKETFDADVMDFVKIGNGSLGGKARGLAFMSTLLQENAGIFERFSEIDIRIPKTIVITTEGFESFVSENSLHRFARESFSDEEVLAAFLAGRMPQWLARDLSALLEQVHYPLSVRSSSLLEDAHFQPYAGLYDTHMIPNNHPDPQRRLAHLQEAVKRVFASTYYQGPKAFSKKTGNAPHEESMAVIIQELAGRSYGKFFYPDLSGLAQSHNFYPVSRMKAEDGIARIALGFGRCVMEGERSLRFCPRYPTILPQFSTIDDILANAQRFFYALQVQDYPDELTFDQNANLLRRDVDEADTEEPVRRVASTYRPDEHAIRDSATLPGVRVLTFAQILKYKMFPLPELLSEIMELGKKGMGCPVEIEFSANLAGSEGKKGAFYFLQMRPMAGNIDGTEVNIDEADLDSALIFSTQALGNGIHKRICDIVYVRTESFQSSATKTIAGEIGRINAMLAKEDRPYLLIGPGRWGTADPWLGIPVRWADISAVGAMVELRNAQLSADPSEGSHFFQNITSLGIPYITVSEGGQDFIRWKEINGLPAIQETAFLRHVRLPSPLVVKIDGRRSVSAVHFSTPPSADGIQSSRFKVQD
ncbi:MAG: phosphoenolpyruvate synthase/pyruvate phosphate dikinase [Desulfobacterales bacterium]|nr:phosphoenolpyruvate synthase/pyruvate phosphate dikinase [Desulfobacterales bacterium]